jgi:hypothetical protein
VIARAETPTSAAEDRQYEARREEEDRREGVMASLIADVMLLFEPQTGGEVDTARTRWAYRQLEHVHAVLDGRAPLPRDPSAATFAEVATGWRAGDGEHVALRDGSHYVRQLTPGGVFEWKEQEPIPRTFRAAVQAR